MKRFLKEHVARYLPHGSAASYVATLVSGTVIGHLAVVAASPVLTRLYSPDEFGILAVYAALLSIISVIAGLRYELAIPLPRNVGSAANLLALTLICIIFTTVLLTFGITIFYHQIPRWLNVPTIAPYLWLLPMGVFLAGFYQTFNYWAIRRKNFSAVARTSIQQGVGGAGAQIALGVANSGSIGLIVGQIIGQCAGLSALVRGAYTQDKRQLKRISWQRIIIVAKRYSRFPKYTTWQAMANTGSVMLPLILFASLLSPAIAGIYMLAHRTLSLPLSLIGRSIGQVFLSRAAEAHHENTLDQLTLRTFQRLLRICLGPLIFVGVLAPELFAFVFGEEWRQAGIYARWMAPWMIAQFVVSPIGTLITVKELQAAGMLSQFGFLVFRVGAILVGIRFSADAAVIAYAISGFIAYFLFGVWVIRKAGISSAAAGGVILKEVSMNLIIVLPLLLVVVMLYKGLP